jgi:hypothetical protein
MFKSFKTKLQENFAKISKDAQHLFVTAFCS